MITSLCIATSVVNKVMMNIKAESFDVGCRHGHSIYSCIQYTNIIQMLNGYYLPKVRKKCIFCSL